jgi:hypothetical protein
MGWLRTFFKGKGVHVHVRKGAAGESNEVKLSGGLARAVRPKLVSFLGSLPIENATFYVTGDAVSGWRIERSSGIDEGTEQRIRNFLANEV